MGPSNMLCLITHVTDVENVAYYEWLLVNFMHWIWSFCETILKNKTNKYANMWAIDTKIRLVCHRVTSFNHAWSLHCSTICKDSIKLLNCFSEIHLIWTFFHQFSTENELGTQMFLWSSLGLRKYRTPMEFYFDVDIFKKSLTLLQVFFCAKRVSCCTNIQTQDSDKDKQSPSKTIKLSSISLILIKYTH